MNIEFIGGPLDGEVMAVREQAPEILIPLASGISVFGPEEPEPYAPAFRIGRYRIAWGVLHGRATWQGEDGPEIPVAPPPKLHSKFDNPPLSFGPDLWDMLGEDWRGFV